MVKKKGYVIALDGPDGVGKTTQLGLLADYLEKKGYKVHATRQSGGTPIGEELRKASLSDHPRSPQTDIYISLAMGQALGEDIQLRKSKGEVILMDRSPLAVVAYNGYGSQLPDKTVAFKTCEEIFKGELIDQLVFLEAPQSVIDSRRQKRGTKDYFERQNAAYHERVRQGYQDGLVYLQKHDELGSKIEIVDATKDISTIHRAIVGLIGL